jgi:hypothetical protein
MNYKKCVFSLALILLCATAMSMNEVLTPDNLISSKTKPSALEFELASQGLTILEDGTVSSWQTSPDVITGNPALPVQYFKFALPYGTDLKSVRIRVDALNQTDLDLTADVHPAPKGFEYKKPDQTDFNEDPFYRNKKVYDADEFYPSEIVSVLISGHLGEYPYATIKYYPFQYNPVQKSFRRVEYLKARLSYKTLDSEGVKTSEAWNSALLSRRAKEKFINFEEVLKLSGQTCANIQKYSQKTGFCIITRNKYVASCYDAFQEFCTHKSYKYDCYIVTEDDYGIYPGKIQEQIRQWLKDNYIQLNLLWVLLVGNPDPAANDVPMAELWPRPVVEYSLKTHYYYADLTGNWDLDGDGYLGEVVDEMTDLPDGCSLSPPFCVQYQGNIFLPNNGDNKLRIDFYEGSLRLKIDNQLVWAGNGLGCYELHTTLNKPSGWYAYELNYNMREKDGYIALYEDFDRDNDYSELKAEFYSDSGEGYISHAYSPKDQCSGWICPGRVYKNTWWFKYWKGDLGPGGMDSEPEVYVGQIPVYNDDFDSLRRILNKIICYERQVTFPNAERKDMLFAAHRLNENLPGYHLGERIREDFLVPRGIPVTRVYDEDYGLIPPPERTPCDKYIVHEEWTKQPRGLVTYWTHGGTNNATNILDSTYCQGLDDTKPSIVFAVSCWNGNPEYPPENLATSLLKNGAIAVTASSRDCIGPKVPQSYHVNPAPSPQLMAYYFADKITYQFGGSAGVALFEVREMPVFWQPWYKNNYGLRDSLMLNLYGDPCVGFESNYPNAAPIADAGGPYTKECEGTTTAVLLDGTGSYDFDDDPLSYSWTTDCPAASFNDSTSPTPILTVNTWNGCSMDCTVTLTVTDDPGGSDTATSTVTIRDTIAPEIICPVGITVECTENCGIQASDPQLDPFFAGVSASDLCDPDPLISDDAPSFFGIGPTTVTFTATDYCGNSSSCTAVVTVVDTTPPEIEVTLNRYVLWPANHKLVEIEASVIVTDVCDPDASFVLTSITSDEPDDGLGDGDAKNDIQEAEFGTADTKFKLRAERAGTGDGRTYTIVYTAYDSCNTTPNNITTMTVYVFVPHSRR